MSHFLSRQITISVFFVLGLLVCGARTQATDISDTISTTLTIFEDSKLVGDVTCDVAGAPCIKFGAPGITLRLNGFTLKGRASPPNNCTGFPTPFVPEDGITTAGQSNVAILGRSEEHTSELQSRLHLVCRLLLEKKTNITRTPRLAPLYTP